MRTLLHTFIGLAVALFCLVGAAFGQATLVTNPPDGHYSMSFKQSVLQIILESNNSIIVNICPGLGCISLLSINSFFGINLNQNLCRTL
jgi:hypothetical protein